MTKKEKLMKINIHFSLPKHMLQAVINVADINITLYTKVIYT
jgi:hypothetical protein